MTEVETPSNHKVATVRHYEAGPPPGLELVDPGETFATTKEEEWISKKTTEVTNTKQVKTRVKRQVVLEDGKIVEDSGPMVETDTTEDTEKKEHHQTELRRLDDDKDNARAIEGQPGPSELVPAANPDGIVREVKEKKIVTRKEFEEKKETEDVQHYGDITDEEFLKAVNTPDSDLRKIILRENETALVSTGPRLIHESHKSRQVTDSEETRELSSVQPDGRIVTETQRTTEHEEVNDDELPEDVPDVNEHKESHERYFKSREQEDVEYVADGVKIGHEMRYKSENTEAERYGNGLDEPDYDSLHARSRRRQNQRLPHKGRGLGPVLPTTSPLDRKDALTRKPLDFDQEEETRKLETSKWLENHFGSESRSSHGSLDDDEFKGDEPTPPRTSYFNVTIKSQPVQNGLGKANGTCSSSGGGGGQHKRSVSPPRTTQRNVSDEQRNCYTNGFYKGINDWSSRQNGYKQERVVSPVTRESPPSSPIRETRPNVSSPYREPYPRDVFPSPPRDYRASPSREYRRPSPPCDYRGTPPRDYHPSPPRDYHPSPPRDYRSSPPRDYRSSPPRNYRSSPSHDYRSTSPRDYHPSPPREYRHSPPRDYRPSPPRDYRSSPPREYRHPSPPREYRSPSPRNLRKVSPPPDYRNRSPTPPHRKKVTEKKRQEQRTEKYEGRKYRSASRENLASEGPLEEPPPDYSPTGPLREISPNKKQHQKTRFANEPQREKPREKSGNIIGQSIRKLVGKIRSASAERKAKQQQKAAQKQRSPSPSYQKGHVIDTNINESPPMNRKKERDSVRRTASPVHRYYLGEDPFGGSIYGRENKYDGVKPNRSPRKYQQHSADNENDYRSHSTLGRFSKSASRLSPAHKDTERVSQTLPRHSSRYERPAQLEKNEKDSTINVSIINTVSSPQGSGKYISNGTPPAKPARTFLSRSKSFNVDLDGPPRNNMYQSNPHLNRINEAPLGLKSPGLITSISRSQRDLTSETIDERLEHRNNTNRFAKNGCSDATEYKQRTFLREARQRTPDFYKTLHEHDEDLSLKPPRGFSTPLKNSRGNYFGDIYEPPTRLRDTQNNVTTIEKSYTPKSRTIITRRGSNSSTDFSETYHTTTENNDNNKSTITDTVESYSRKTIPGKSGKGIETIQSTEKKSITKSTARYPPTNHYDVYEREKRFYGTSGRSGPVVIEVRNEGYRK